jgi:hypothetical protein
MPTRCKDIYVYINNSKITQWDAKTLPNLWPSQIKLVNNNVDVHKILYKTKTNHNNFALLVSTKFEREIPKTLEFRGHIPMVYQGSAMHCWWTFFLNCLYEVLEVACQSNGTLIHHHLQMFIFSKTYIVVNLNITNMHLLVRNLG